MGLLLARFQSIFDIILVYPKFENIMQFINKEQISWNSLGIN